MLKKNLKSTTKQLTKLAVKLKRTSQSQCFKIKLVSVSILTSMMMWFWVPEVNQSWRWNWVMKKASDRGRESSWCWRLAASNPESRDASSARQSTRSARAKKAPSSESGLTWRSNGWYWLPNYTDYRKITRLFKNAGVNQPVMHKATRVSLVTLSKLIKHWENKSRIYKKKLTDRKKGPSRLKLTRSRLMKCASITDCFKNRAKSWKRNYSS